MSEQVKTVDSPLKWHGGKHYLASKIIELMPEHLHYVEPYAGGLSVLLRKNPEGVSEVVNDLHKDLSNFWRVLQGGDSFRAFQRLCEATPFSEAEWEDAELEMMEYPEPNEMVSDSVVRAWRFFIYCRQSLAGRMDRFAPLSLTRIRREMNEQASAWLTTVEGLSEVHARLKRVVVLNQDAIDVIYSQDNKRTLFYLDPPYVHGTRRSTDTYHHEMTLEKHQELLDLIKRIQSKVMISGYRSELYDGELNSWNRHEFELPNNAAAGQTKRRMTECVWCNF